VKAAAELHLPPDLQTYVTLLRDAAAQFVRPAKVPLINGRHIRKTAAGPVLAC
jgi:hypothetical protein